MTEHELYDSLTALFSEIFLRDDIALAATTTAADIDGWDSFKQIEIVMAVEERFGIRLLTREIDSLKQVGDLVAVIDSKIR